MRRELYHLARVTSEVLAGCGLDATRAAPMIEAIDARLTAAMPDGATPALPRTSTVADAQRL